MSRGELQEAKWLANRLGAKRLPRRDRKRAAKYRARLDEANRREVLEWLKRPLPLVEPMLPKLGRFCGWVRHSPPLLTGIVAH